MAHHAEGAERLVTIDGRRAFEQLAIRTAARSTGPVRALAPADLLEALTPLWRKRAADGEVSELWVIGDREPRLPVELSGRVAEVPLTSESGGTTALLATPDIGMVGEATQATVRGYWTSDPIVVAVISAAFRRFVGTHRA